MLIIERASAERTPAVLIIQENGKIGRPQPVHRPELVRSDAIAVISGPRALVVPVAITAIGLQAIFRARTFVERRERYVPIAARATFRGGRLRRSRHPFILSPGLKVRCVDHRATEAWVDRAGVEPAHLPDISRAPSPFSYRASRRAPADRTQLHRRIRTTPATS